MQQYGWISKTLWWTKETRQKIVLTIWFHLHRKMVKWGMKLDATLCIMQNHTLDGKILAIMRKASGDNEKWKSTVWTPYY